MLVVHPGSPAAAGVVQVPPGIGGTKLGMGAGNAATGQDNVGVLGTTDPVHPPFREPTGHAVSDLDFDDNTRVYPWCSLEIAGGRASGIKPNYDWRAGLFGEISALCSGYLEVFRSGGAEGASSCPGMLPDVSRTRSHLRRCPRRSQPVRACLTRLVTTW